MDGSSLSKELLFIQENEKVPYDLLSKFAEEPKYLELYIQKYGLKFYQKSHLQISPRNNPKSA